jgi:hypothetical protein
MRDTSTAHRRFSAVERLSLEMVTANGVPNFLQRALSVVCHYVRFTIHDELLCCFGGGGGGGK